MECHISFSKMKYKKNENKKSEINWRTKTSYFKTSPRLILRLFLTNSKHLRDFSNFFSGPPLSAKCSSTGLIRISEWQLLCSVKLDYIVYSFLIANPIWVWSCNAYWLKRYMVLLFVIKAISQNVSLIFLSYLCVCRIAAGLLLLLLLLLAICV